MTEALSLLTFALVMLCLVAFVTKIKPTAISEFVGVSMAPSTPAVLRG